MLLGREQRTDAKVGWPSAVSGYTTIAIAAATISAGLVVMVVVMLLEQERMESHLGLREQLIDLLSLFETHGGGSARVFRSRQSARPRRQHNTNEL